MCGNGAGIYMTKNATALTAAFEGGAGQERNAFAELLADEKVTRHLK